MTRSDPGRKDVLPEPNQAEGHDEEAGEGLEQPTHGLEQPAQEPDEDDLGGLTH